MGSHFVYMLVFATAVGAVLGTMLRRRPWEAARLAVKIALGMIVAALVISWLMYLLQA